MYPKYKKYWRSSTMYQHGDIFLEILKKKKPKNFLEIGVYTGVNARNICEYLFYFYGNDFKYYGLDLFEDYSEINELEIAPNSIRRYKQKFSNPLKYLYYNIIKKEQLNSIDSVLNFLKKFKNNIKLIKGDTKKTLKNVDTTIFDMIYIDGGHSFETVYYELGFLLDNTKKDCYILCDDYTHGEAKGVKQAVDQIVKEKKLQIEIHANRFASILR
ncbi:class I SAM-dependent methyltransferase [Candidatus Pelagibacter sp. HIMB1493]|uniref:class I SAM-dependent methyltransferase n=1 Tax=Candidatus Pelagibacter sp. HIMB1493 TaxID=3413334 RepID=UPI003F83CB0F